MNVKYHSWLFQKYFILLGILLLNAEVVSSQTKIQVITKTISKNIPYTVGKTIKIVGEKAAISIQSWDKDYISANISLIAKHPNKKTAEDDIRFIDYKVIESGEIIELSNFFSQKTGYKEITSNLTAKFDIKVPSSCLLSIVDVYGSVSLKNVSGKINIDLNFAQLSMNNIEGGLSIKTYYGDIDAESINAALKLDSEMADLTFHSLSGTCIIQSKYGNMHISPNEKLTKLDINANKTFVQILINKFDAYCFKIETLNADLSVPEILKKQIVHNSGKYLFQQINEKPLIQVVGKYSSITLKIK